MTGRTSPPGTGLALGCVLGLVGWGVIALVVILIVWAVTR